MLSRLSVVAILAAAICALAFGVTREASEVVATNGIPPGVFPETPLLAGEKMCDGIGGGIEQADGIRITAGAERDNPPLKLTIPGQPGSRTLTGYRDGVVVLPLPEGRRNLGARRACVTNDGPNPVFIAGAVNPDGTGGTVDRVPVGFSYSLWLVENDPPKWTAIVGDAVERLGFARGGAATGGTGWVALVPFVLAFGLVLAAVGRWVR